MSSPVMSTRRSSRAGEGSPGATPVSHPLHGDLSPGGGPSVRKPARKNGSTGPTGSPAAVYTLAVLLVAGGILYNRLYMRDAAGADGPSSPRRSALEQPGDAPPLPSLTPEEVAVFEQAAEEHYGLPPGYQLPHFEEKEVQPSNYGEEFEVAADAQHEAEHEEEAEAVHGEEAQERPLSRADEEAAAAAEAAFDAEVHSQYLDLPPWPNADEAVLTGSWQFDDHVYDYAARLPMTQTLSWDNPRLVLFPSFLSPDEVRHMIRVSKDNLERSEVLVAEGEDTQSDIRTSSGFWPEPDDVIDAITERLHRALGIPQAFGEGLYVLNYQVDQKYEAHNDHCMDGYSKVAEPACLDFLKRAGGPECGPGKGGPTCGDRVATFILYLKSPTRGGQTAFPEADVTKSAMGEEHRPGNSPDEWYCYDERVLSAAPPPGTGVLFWDYRPGNGTSSGSYRDGSADPAAQTQYSAMHSGCPVLEGEKYIATRWIRAAGFDYRSAEA